MPLFSSQFDRARGYSDAYVGPPGDASWRVPAAVAAAGVGALALTAAAVEADGTWGDGWDTGWEAPAPEAPADDGSAWMDRGDYTDAGVGGDDDFFYFIDGDTSLTID
jgi:hypothetical protein